ncbi:hypothetical protein D4R99_03845 [bacterium]|nr:MAG: hypothetical protein D4R99_03845 [bacterium]
MPAIGSAISIPVFVIFYAIGKYFKKWSIKFILSLVCFESILLIPSILFLGNIGYSDFSLISGKINVNGTPTVMSKICDAYYGDSRKNECWNFMVKAHPYENVCLRTNSSWGSCVSAEGRLYIDSDSCEKETGVLSVTKETLGTEDYIKITNCWKQKAKKYPDADICEHSYMANQKDCVRFFDTLPQEERVNSGKIRIPDDFNTFYYGE